MRRLSALVVVASVAAVLTGCSGADSSSSCDAGIPSGNASSIVDASGQFDTAPTVTFPQPLITKSIERSVLLRGTKAPLRNGQPVVLEATILNGTDGSVLQQTSYTQGGGSLFTIGDSGLPALGRGLECASVGSRVAVVASGKESASGGAAATNDSIVYVVDLIRAFKSRADGTDQLPVAGMPSIVLAPDGTPGITIPHEDAPTKYRASVLKLGDGKTVTKDQTVVVKYTAVKWDTATVTKSTWATGSSDILQLSGTTVSEGLKRAITGKTIGSQVLAVLPPELASNSDDSVPPDAALVYVVDILGTLN